MITGAHAIIYSKDAQADRAFFRDVLCLGGVDAGRGWLIFALPPSEVALHPRPENGLHELHLMCPDLTAELKDLAAKEPREHFKPADDEKAADFLSRRLGTFFGS